MTIQPVPGVQHAPPSERRIRQTPLEAFEQTFARIEPRQARPTQRREAPAAEGPPRPSRDDQRASTDTDADRASRASTDDGHADPASSAASPRQGDHTDAADAPEAAEAEGTVTDQVDEANTDAQAQADDGEAQPAVTVTNLALAAATGQADTQAGKSGSASSTRLTAAPVASPTMAVRQGGEPAGDLLQVQVVTPSQQSGENAQTATGDDAASQQPGAQSRAQAQAVTTAPSASPSAGASVVPSSAPPTAAPPPAPPAAVATSAQTSLPDADTNGTDANVARVTRALNNSVNQNGGSLTLRLTPAELGTVRIELRIDGGTVQANLHAETSSVRDLLQQQISHLRTALEARGLSVERLEVQTMPNNNSSAFEHEQQADHSAGDGRSRGRFDSQQSRQQQARQARDGAAFDELVAQAQA